MGEDEFRRKVLAALGRVEESQAAHAERQAGIEGQLAAIVARFDDQEAT